MDQNPGLRALNPVFKTRIQVLEVLIQCLTVVYHCDIVIYNKKYICGLNPQSWHSAPKTSEFPMW